MKQSDLTKWGEWLLYARGLCGGLWLAYAMAFFTHREADVNLLWIAVCGSIGSGLLVPLLRALGWRGLAERLGEAPTTPRPGEVERALRTALQVGLPLPDALRRLYETRGWDVMELYPAVAKVAALSPKEAIRLVMTETVLAGSSAVP
jgi:hypothetical protein